MVFWQARSDTVGQGRETLIYVDLLVKDVGSGPAEAPSPMKNKKMWRVHIRVAASISSEDDRL